MRFETKSERAFWEAIYVAALQLSTVWQQTGDVTEALTPVEIADRAVMLRRDRDNGDF